MRNKFTNKKIKLRYIYYMEKRNINLVADSLLVRSRISILLTIICTSLLIGCSTANIQSEKEADESVFGTDVALDDNESNAAKESEPLFRVRW